MAEAGIPCRGHARYAANDPFLCAAGGAPISRIRRRAENLCEGEAPFRPEIIARLSAKTESELFGQDEAPRVLVRAMKRCWDQKLTPCQRRYLTLYYRDRMTLREIGALCGVDFSTVSRTIRRGRNRLREILQYYL